MVVAATLRILSEYVTGDARHLDIENYLLTISLFGSDFIPNDFLVEPIFWTLAIEIKFYLIVGAAYYLASKFKFDVFAIFFLVSVFLAIGRFHLMPFHPQYQWATNFGVLASTLPMLFIGWLYWMHYSRVISYGQFVPGLICIVLVLSIAPFPIYVSVEKGAPSWMLAFFVFCCLLHFQEYFTFMKGVVLQFLGKLSYSMYACHMAVAVAVKFYLPTYNVATFLFFVLVVIVLSYFVNRYVEVPVANIGKRIMQASKLSKKSELDGAI
ncbi:acyltransferase family protein [Pseudomonas fluorescens group sp. PF-1]